MINNNKLISLFEDIILDVQSCFTHCNIYTGGFSDEMVILVLQIKYIDEHEKPYPRAIHRFRFAFNIDTGEFRDVERWFDSYAICKYNNTSITTLNFETYLTVIKDIIYTKLRTFKPYSRKKNILNIINNNVD